MFKLYRQNFLGYILLALSLILFFKVPELSLKHWFDSKIYDLEVKDICLKEFDRTPMENYFAHDKNSVKVTWDIIENEGISRTYKMKAKYGWVTSTKDYETKYIYTGYGEMIKNGLDGYLKDYPNIKIH